MWQILLSPVQFICMFYQKALSAVFTIISTVKMAASAVYNFIFAFMSV